MLFGYIQPYGFISVGILARLAFSAFAPPTLLIHGDDFRPDAILHVTLQDYQIGCITRPSPVVNGSIPGPELRFPSRRVWVRVYNDMDGVNLTMHWHGISLAAAPFADGSVNASQFPICPHCYFDYELALSRVEAGTYFYHSHVGFQAATAFGPLVVEDSDPAGSPYTYEDERILAFHELFNKTNSVIEPDLLASNFTWTGEPGALLLNGYGISNYTHTNTASNCALPVIDVVPSKKYRLRMIGGTALSYVSISINQHPDLVIIEADGAYTQALTVDHVQVSSGERYSVLLEAFSCEKLVSLGRSDFYIIMQTAYRPSNITAYAVLRYNTSSCDLKTALTPLISTEKAPDQVPGPLPPIETQFLYYKLRPLQPYPDAFPRGADVTRRLVLQTYNMLPSPTRPSWKFNNNSWVEDTPAIPYLVALYKDAENYLPDYDVAVANGGVDKKTDAWPARMGEVLEIIMHDSGSPVSGGVESHPIHMHGAHFYDIGGGKGPYDPKLNEPLLEHQLATGGIPKRDTVFIDRYANETGHGQVHSWRGFRIKVTEAGVWMLHCHTLAHMLMGMQMVFVFGTAKDIINVGVPGIEGYLTYGGNATGQRENPPQVIHWFDEDDKGNDTD